MKSLQPQNAEFRNNPENFHPCSKMFKLASQSDQSSMGSQGSNISSGRKLRLIRRYGCTD